MRDDKGKSEGPLLQINTFPSADIAEGRLRVIYERKVVIARIYQEITQLLSCLVFACE